MRFLILTQYFPPEIGAAQVRLASMARELGMMGHQVEIVTAMPNHPTGRIFPGYTKKFYYYELWEKMPVYRTWVLPSVGAGVKRMLNYTSFTTTSLFALTRALKPDYMFVESPPLFLSLPGVIASRLWGIPLIFNISDLWPDSVSEMGLMDDGIILRMLKALERWTYKKSDYITAVTEGIHRVLIEDKGVPPEKVLFLPNGVDQELFKPRPPDNELSRHLGLEGKKIILYAGTMGFAHGLEVAIQAMELLQTDNPDILLVFIGGGSEKEKLAQMAVSKGLNNIKFLDPRPPEFIARLYSIAFAGLASAKNLPLFRGARSSKMFPVMASGKPVVYRGDGEGPLLVEEAEAGLVIKPEDPLLLAEAIQVLANNPDLAAKLGRNGRNYVETYFSWPVLVRDWLSQLLKEQPENG